MDNLCVVLKRRPSGVAQADDFAIVEAPVAPPEEGDLIVQNLYLSVEPAMRGWIADTSNYAAPVMPGEVMRSLAVGRVLHSRAPQIAEGALVLGWLGWQLYARVTPAAIVRIVRETDLPASLALGVLGINGVTAYLALNRIGEPRPGETVVVSTAAGAVGSVVGQLARRVGCRTIGIAGGEAKAAQAVARYGYDEALDYRAPDFADKLAAACRGGVDIYFDNTSGPISDLVHAHLAERARIIVCGTAAIADWSEWPVGPRVERHLLVKRARMQGFVVFDHLEQWDAVIGELAASVRDGSLVYDEDVLEGLAAAPDALAGLYRGENRGKRVIRL